ncbi:MAG: diadenylate cyclase CdaA [Candidatus Omnitrophica bacterium]|nr:diadenylate cyclase CdaA [Candidatus Omnitrophota bacterium]
MLDYIASIWKPFLEIAILWLAFYAILVFIKETRAFQVLKGLVIFLLVIVVTMTFLSQRMGLYTLNWIIEKFFAVLIFAFLVIFHPELRQGLARIGEKGLFKGFAIEGHVISEIVRAAFFLSSKKVGAIISIERTTSLKPYTETGTTLDGCVSQELLSTIFIPNTPLHDGSVIIRLDRIVAAGCLLPLSDNPKISKGLGTRHRAAIGLTEETDAIAIVVSEETGSVSLAISGRLTRDLNEEGLERVLINLCHPVKHKRKAPVRFFRRKKEPKA